MLHSLMFKSPYQEIKEPRYYKHFWRSKKCPNFLSRVR